MIIGSAGCKKASTYNANRAPQPPHPRSGCGGRGARIVRIYDRLLDQFTRDNSPPCSLQCSTSGGGSTAAWGQPVGGNEAYLGVFQALGRAGCGMGVGMGSQIGRGAPPIAWSTGGARLAAGRRLLAPLRKPLGPNQIAQPPDLQV